MDITINMTQPRVATGNNQDGKTIYGVYRNVNSNNEDISWQQLPSDYDKYFERIGTVTIIHPIIISGDKTEIEEDFNRAIRRELEKQPNITVNDYGVLFVN